MRNAFALLGVGFMVIIVATYILFTTPAEAPEGDNATDTTIHATSSAHLNIEEAGESITN
jgi:hypothetical protein